MTVVISTRGTKTAVNKSSLAIRAPPDDEIHIITACEIPDNAVSDCSWLLGGDAVVEYAPLGAHVHCHRLCHSTV